MSKKVVIEIDERFAGVLSITAVKGAYPNQVNVSTYAFDLSQGANIRIDENGRGWQSSCKGYGNG